MKIETLIEKLITKDKSSSTSWETSYVLTSNFRNTYEGRNEWHLKNNGSRNVFFESVLKGISSVSDEEYLILATINFSKTSHGFALVSNDMRPLFYSGPIEALNEEDNNLED